MKKKMSKVKKDKDAEKFLDQDLTNNINLKNFTSVNFEMLRKDKQVNLRFSEQLLSAVRQKADQEGISYQKYTRKAIMESLTSQ